VSISGNFLQLWQDRAELNSHKGVSFFSGNLARAVTGWLARTIYTRGRSVDRMFCLTPTPGKQGGAAIGRELTGATPHSEFEKWLFASDEK
jgi:hypothetical protein